jgi:creatinine amidohydrolase
MRISRLTMTRFDEGRQRTMTVIQPFGSIEEHGLHLPLSTDTIQVREVCIRAGEETGAFVAPAIPYGVCRSTGNHPGTIGISTSVLRLLVIDLGLAFHRQGLRNFLFISGHAGKTHLMTILDAAEELLDRLPDIRAAVVSEYNELLKEGRELIETEDDSHAGEVETSRIQFLCPDLVEGTSPEEYPSFPPHVLVRDKRRYWPGGVWGNPEKASAEKGRQLMEIAVRHLAGIVRRLEEKED